MVVYSTIKIEGNIFSADLLEKVANVEDGIIGQINTDFYLDKQMKVKDRISEAWADLNDYWRIFKRKVEKLTEKESGTSEVRKLLMTPFFEELAYALELDQSKKEIRGVNYPISHRSNRIENFPIHIVGIHQDLDKKVKRGRHSPHGLLQEYINLTDHLYGMVTNGYVLRLLRDSSRFIKLSYIEFNLEKMFDEGHFADFALLYRLLHASRMEENNKKESIIESYHQDALESGAAIRDSLSSAVENSIVLLANAFIKLNPEAFEGEYGITAKQLYENILFLIYKKLFLFVIEERKLVFTESFMKENAEQVDIYYRWYSLSRIRTLAEKSPFYNKKHFDLWQSILQTFKLFELEENGRGLGIKPLAGRLFSLDAIRKISELKLDNKTIIEVFRSLTIFKENGIKRRVNYSALNVEEFGSVYESLLEYEPIFRQVNLQLYFQFEKGKERSSSGSHYTPDTFVKPLIDHSLVYLIDAIKKEESSHFSQEKALLSLKICDPASGSGHLLLNSARKIGFELAKIRTQVQQPSAEDIRKGVRDAIHHCIYGVDKNALAVELCKVALWLEAHNPGEPLNFLDHKIKHGDAVVGVARIEELEEGISEDAFKKIAGDDAKVASDYKKAHKKQRKEDKDMTKLAFNAGVTQTFTALLKNYQKINRLPENTPEDIEKKRSKYHRFKGSKEYRKLENLANLMLSPYFISKTDSNKKFIPTHDDYKEELNRSLEQITSEKTREANNIAFHQHFFHWFLEFPEVFTAGGFDVMIGNPPFLGGQKLSGHFGQDYLHYLKHYYKPAKSADLVAFFFRRGFEVIKEGRFLSFISTNTISQGTTREVALDYIYLQGGKTHFAIRSKKWPGRANVSVSLLSLYKGKWRNKYVLDNKKVDFINPYLTDDVIYGNPDILRVNENKSFQGSIVLGIGFTMSEGEAKAIIQADERYRDVLFPYLNGADVNRDPLQRPSRWVINFFDWDEAYCKENYPICYDIVKEKVKPERMRLNNNPDGRRRKKYWWHFGRNPIALYSTTKDMKKVLVVTQVSKTLGFLFVNNNIIYDQGVIVFALDKYFQFVIMQSSLHNAWAWRYSSTMKNDLSYSPSKAFQTFPFPDISESARQELEALGESYYSLREELTTGLWLGLTKVYNLFHKKDLSVQDILIPDAKDEGIQKAQMRSAFELLEPMAFKALALEKINELRVLHKKMDELVLSAYGWNDLHLAHDFYAVDYLPENDRIRYTISPEARKEVLKRLLLLNFKRSKEEQKISALKLKKTKKKPKKDAKIGKSLF